MGMRFRKSFKIAPGVKFNVNKKSVGMTFGGKGVHYTVNSSGRRTTSVGAPGTGLYYQSVSGGSGSSSNRQQTTRTRQIISDTCPCCGTVNSKHEAFCPVCGQPLSEPVRQATPPRYTAPPQYIPPQPVKVKKDHTNLIMLIVIIIIYIGSLPIIFSLLLSSAIMIIVVRRTCNNQINAIIFKLLNSFHTIHIVYFI